jgi:putative thioredoxin
VSTGSHTVDINAQNFQSEVAEKSKHVPVLLEFYAPGAEQCAQTSELLKKLVVEYQGKFTLARVDIQQNEQLVQQLQVRALPSIKIIFQGQMAGDIEGPAEEKQLRETLDQLTMSPMDRVRGQIDLLLEQGARGQAIQMLQDVIAEEPANLGLQAELSDLLIMEGQINKAREILTGLPLDTEGIDKPKSRLDFIDLAEELGEIESLRSTAESDAASLQDRFDYAIKLIVIDHVEKGLEELFKILLADKTWNEEKARLTMIKVFSMLGKGNELATRFRRKMFTHLH